MDLFKILTLEEGVGISMQNSSKVMICWIDMEILGGCRGSYSTFFLMMKMAGSTGMDVKMGLKS